MQNNETQAFIMIERHETSMFSNTLPQITLLSIANDANKLKSMQIEMVRSKEQTTISVITIHSQRLLQVRPSHSFLDQGLWPTSRSRRFGGVEDLNPPVSARAARVGLFLQLLSVTREQRVVSVSRPTARCKNSGTNYFSSAPPLKLSLGEMLH